MPAYRGSGLISTAQSRDCSAVATAALGINAREVEEPFQANWRRTGPVAAITKAEERKGGVLEHALYIVLSTRVVQGEWGRPYLAVKVLEIPGILQRKKKKMKW